MPAVYLIVEELVRGEIADARREGADVDSMSDEHLAENLHDHSAILQDINYDAILEAVREVRAEK